MARHRGRSRPFARTRSYVPFHAIIYWSKPWPCRGLNLYRKARTVAPR